MDRDRDVGVAGQPVDVRRPEREPLAGAVVPLPVGAADAQPVLEQPALDDLDGAGGGVVVVPAGVVAGMPDDRPDVDAGVAVQ